ncbi:MAG TPA: Ig-like domain-containing protein [Candidatus Saccharimonadales bacterium]|nr:Ig-like domain-containing protein [Candidatus Saccharimonadales bacterium]
MKTAASLHGVARGLLLVLTLKLAMSAADAATLTGSFVSIARGAVVDLTAEGPLDWVHWGLYTEASLDRKANVVEQISDLSLVAPSNFFGFAYQFGDNWAGYSWSDGTPDVSVTDTTTGVYVVGMNHGFQLSVPAGTTVKTIKVYVGAYGATGKFQASLSDNSAPAYLDSSLSNAANGPNGMYLISFAGRSAGSRLIIKWTVAGMLDPVYGNVTIQSATLTSANANNPPFVDVTSPTENATFTAGGNIALAANAVDFDGSIAKVEFFQGATKLGEDSTSPFSLSWTGVPAGKYSIWARATDDRGASSSSEPVDIFVNTSGGTISGSVSKPPTLPTLVNLTTEGTADWVHWGTRTNGGLLDRKAGVVTQIGDYTAIGNGTVDRFADNYTGFSWSDGTPTATASATTTGVFIPGLTNGFELSLPADTTTRTVKVYVGLYAAKGNFQAWLSDYSAKAYADTSLSNFFGNGYGAYTLNYRAASAGQTLTVHFTAKEAYDPDFANVTLQSVTLVGGTPPPNSPPVITITTPTNGTVFTAPASFSLGATASDGDGSVSQVQFFNGGTSLSVDTTSPYSVAVSSLAAGSYTLSAVATDNQGAKATNSVGIVVNNPPTAAITSPANGASFIAPANITLAATANDTDGSVAKVEFFEGANKLGEDTTSPYSFAWNSVAAGSYTLTVKATDDRGATTSSAAITISVTNSLGAPVVIQDPFWSGGDFQFSFMSQSGHGYEVHYTDTLGSRAWQLLTTLTGDGSMLSVTQRNASASQRMYRVETK